MAGKKKFQFKSGEHLIRELKKYIQECGFRTTAKSFGNVSSGNDGDHSSEPVPNEYEYYVMVSVVQFMNYIEREEKYLYDYIEHHQKRKGVELLSRVRVMLYDHNSVGADLGHIPQYRFKQWETSVFNNEEILEKRKITKAKRRQEESKAMILERTANDERMMQAVVNRVLGDEPSE